MNNMMQKNMEREMNNFNTYESYNNSTQVIVNTIKNNNYIYVF